MLPYNQPFRSMLRKYIPTLRNEKIKEHESMVCIHRQLLRERHIRPKLKIADKIEHTLSEAFELTLPYQKSIDRARQLWMIRKQYAVRQRNFLQIPSSPINIYRFVVASLHFHWVRMVTLPMLWISRVKYSFQLMAGKK